MGFFQPHLNVPSIPEIREVRPQAKDNIVLADMQGYSEHITTGFFGNAVDSKYKRGLEFGDNSLVATSDKYLALMEERGFMSKTWTVANDVVGTTPIVPAYIAGHQANMRKRVRNVKPTAPLSIFLESTGSAGAMTQEACLERGAAMLALVRILSDQRPVDLWVCVTYGHFSEMNGLLIRIETQPLDLGRAAHMLVNIWRAAGYGSTILGQVIGHNSGSWSYGVPELERAFCGEIFKRFLHPNSDVLYVPAAYLGDNNITAPGKWLQDMLVRYGGDTVEREDGEERASDNAEEALKASQDRALAIGRRTMAGNIRRRR